MDTADNSGRRQVAEPTRPEEAIIAANETALLRYAARLVNNSEAAQDVVQNAFIKFFRRWAPGTLSADAARHYLFRITHNEAVDDIRRTSRRQRLHNDYAGEQAVLADAGRDRNRTDELQEVLTHMRALPAAEQQVLLLRLQEGLPYEDISRITGRSIGNVGCLLHQAVTKLSQRLGKSRQNKCMHRASIFQTEAT